ncbi:hypothetical protein GCM10007415_29950 [Parapedobacter pyrenivorans]|uniref:Uncharacterized protein n=1 Tax=Parapedobacter pyrenivorans TaxID=1305674 RepID=A0A917HWW9_9SPHI|nr:hypothetical protein [Parapedobacter pyrenivorans]GGG93131.1 hypothetical protein GCM10007415_29950 [Parapedobacter pyrenivorans]
MTQHHHIRRMCLTCVILAWGASSCNGPNSASVVGSSTSYFSLVDYFDREATRLQQLAPSIVKTVAKNGEQESKEIRIIDWREEFALFIDADINKPAWQNSYHVDSSNVSAVIYKSIDPKLRTAQITVEKQEDGSVTHIQIINKVSNMLYHTDEELDYYPDSLYRIVKRQGVRVIGESDYTVIGKWK